MIVKLALSWSWWYTPLILDLWRLRLEDCELEASLSYIVKLCLLIAEMVPQRWRCPERAQDLLPQNTKPGCMLRRQCFCFGFSLNFLTNRNPSSTFPNLPSSEQVIKSGKDFPTFLETDHSAGTRGALSVLRGKSPHPHRRDRHGSSCILQFIAFTSHPICPIKRFHNWTLSLEPPIFKKFKLSQA